MTYQDLYLQHLEQRFNQGGKQADVDKTISEFNNPTDAGFETWLKELPWAACSTCGDSFKPTDLEPHPKLNAEILCQTHRT